MSKFHLNPESGEVNQCKATVKPCKFGDGLHYTSKEAGEKAFALSLKNESFSSISKKIEPKTYSDMADDFNKRIAKIEQLALGRNSNRAADALYEASSGRLTMRGRIVPPTAHTVFEALQKAKRAIGPKGNPAAYEEVTAMLAELEESKELKNDMWHQNNKIMKETKFPKGSKKAVNTKLKRNYVILPDASEIRTSVNREPDGENYSYFIRYNEDSKEIDSSRNLHALLARYEGQ